MSEILVPQGPVHTSSYMVSPRNLHLNNLRIVFDASARSTTGVSLNDTLLLGLSLIIEDHYHT